jgi:hypothetical protein
MPGDLMGKDLRRDRMRITQILLAVAIFCFAPEVSAQHMFELRGADTRYRYLDWNYTFANSALVDLFYVGVPGSNEFNLGGGFGFKVGPGLMIAPLVYAVIGKEGSQRGVKIAVLIFFEKGGWKLNSFLGHFAPVSGQVERYQVLDTFDLTRMFAKRWEAGISSGFFHSEGKWNPQIGPAAKLNDGLGYTAVSYRFGADNELRVSRVFILK